MSLKLICLILLFIGAIQLTACTAQTVKYNGLYIIIDKTKDCPNLKATLSDQNATYCMSQRPIISEDEFISISEIRLDTVARKKTITLKLSPNGFNTWKGIIKNFPEKQMALVVNGFVTGTFKNKGEIPASIIPISGSLNSAEIDWIYKYLKKPQANDKKE